MRAAHVNTCSFEFATQHTNKACNFCFVNNV